MSFVKNSLTSIVTFVIFAVLIVVSAVLYGATEDQKAETDQNVLWQKLEPVISLAKSGWEFLAAGDETSYSTASIGDGQNGTAGNFWDELGAEIKTEWEKGENSPASGARLSDYFDWQRTAEGFDLIVREKDGTEHTISFPFAFLKR